MTAFYTTGVKSKIMMFPFRFEQIILGLQHRGSTTYDESYTENIVYLHLVLARV